MLDTGLQRVSKGGKIYSALKGCIDGGLNVPTSEDVFPNADKISGAHIAEYAKIVKDKTQFTKLKKNKVNPEAIVADFNKSKDNITKGAK